MESIRQADNAQFIAQLKYCKNLPTLPTVALQLIELADDGEATLDEFAELIERDPALMGKLLRTANSPFYGRRRKVANLSEAISLMGLNATTSLSLSFSLRGLSNEQGDDALNGTNYWSRSLLTALAARTIAVELGESQPEEFLLAGLLQDIGVLAMATMLGSSYVSCYNDSLNHADLLQEEAATYGFNHVQAGTELLQYWRLPDRICQSVQHSHAETQITDGVSPRVRRLSSCVAAAAHIADGWLGGASAESFGAAYQAVSRFLDISLDRYERIITTIGQEIPEMETLFDSKMLDPSLLQSIQDSARELLAMYNLRLAQASIDADHQIKAFERRIAMLEVQTRRDPLTGLYNRVYLDGQLEYEFEHALQNKLALSVAYIDVDYFKVFNDTFGHAVGDQVLVTVAHRLLSGSRQTDTVARYGGEEFIVLLPDTRIDDAKKVLVRMLTDMRNKPCFTRDGQDFHVTFSAGIAELKPGETLFESPFALLKAADTALYQTKANGRGQITVYDAAG